MRWSRVLLGIDYGLLLGGCPFLRHTGVPCPSCGGVRALGALGRGDLLGAFYWNPLVPLILLAAGLALIPAARRRMRRIPIVAVFGVVLLDWIWVLCRGT